ncbi:MAG: hypothetical protein NC548_63295 [Lachnospiraceae bacterium]|nr:hypothetical protein [Lachnospiraceae bacterium]
MALASSLPIVLQEALSFLGSFLLSRGVKFGRSGERQRAMRSDRRENILAVASVLLRGCCLQHEGIICHFSGLWVRPMSIPEIATLAQVCPKTVSRCIADLVDLGLLKSTQIKRKNYRTGQIEVSIGIRHFTEKFWDALGLLEDYKKAVAWAKENAKRYLVMPFKGVHQKIKSTVTAAKNIVNQVMENLTPDQQRVREKSAWILNMLRQKK